MMATQHTTEHTPPGAGTPARLDPAVRDAIEVFLKHLAQSDLPPVARVLLYGSQARGEAHAESDIDLAVVLAGEAPPRDERSELSWQLSYIRSDAILETLQPLSAVLLWEPWLEDPDRYASAGFYHNLLNDGLELVRH